MSVSRLVAGIAQASVIVALLLAGCATQPKPVPPPAVIITMDTVMTAPALHDYRSDRDRRRERQQLEALLDGVLEKEK